ncbi:hypothetical protein C0995_015016 [Termitomyces sp. Mi166|nr:hypothetical protein C0995_015016 [Termitomyces sp. Mi166\
MAGVIQTGTMKNSFSSIIKIIGRIVGPVLTVTIFASLVAYAKQQGYPMLQTNSIVPLLSVVVGLLLVFRTSYDRYWEGRKSFATLTSNIRNLARQIWVSVVLPPTDTQPPHIKGKTPTTNVTASQLRHRKIEAVKLTLSFAFAAKHYLRGEDGIKYDDYVGVLPQSFARFDEVGFNVEHTPTMPYSATRKDSNGESGVATPDRKPDATKRVRHKRSKQNTSGSDSVTPTTPLLGSAHQIIEFHAYADEASLPLPLMIASEINRILFGFRKEGFLETIGPAGKFFLRMKSEGLMDVDRNECSDTVGLEYDGPTYSYGTYREYPDTRLIVHLKQCVTLYLFALPFALVSDLGWTAVPIVTVVAFTFMGIEGIAEEIEMPFGLLLFIEGIALNLHLSLGNDERDLPLDRYCQDLEEEIDERFSYMIERIPEGGEGLHGYDDGEGDD